MRTNTLLIEICFSCFVDHTLRLLIIYIHFPLRDLRVEGGGGFTLIFLCQFLSVAVPRAQVSTRVRNPLKSSVTNPSLVFLVDCYLEMKFHKTSQGDPLLQSSSALRISFLPVLQYGKVNF